MTCYADDTEVFSEVLQTLDNIQGNYNINFKLYDNWEFQKNDVLYNHEYKPGVGDGIADQVFIFNRDLSRDGYAAEKTLADVNFNSNDGVEVSTYSGSRVFGFKNAITPGAVGGPAHEYCHYLLGGGQTTGHFDGNNYYPWQTGNQGRINKFALMCAVSAGWMSAYERYRLGWINPFVVEANIAGKILKDTHINNEAILIPLRDPYKGSWREFYLIENYHTQRDYAGANPFLVDELFGDPFTHGLLVFHIEDQDFTLPCATKINILCADGKWSWKLLQGASSPSDRSDDLMGKDQPMRFGNFDEMLFITINVGGINYNDYVCLDHHPSYPGSKYNRNDFLGDFDDFFREGYNDVLTKYSNPASYLISGTPKDVGFEIVSYNTTTKEYTLSLQVDLNGVNSLKPSKPQNIKVSVTSDRHPKIIWDDNLEPDISEYRIYRSANPTDGFVHIGTVAFSNPINSCSYIDFTITVPRPREPQGTIYYYRVTARDNQPLESVKSDYVSAISNQIEKDMAEQNEISPLSFILNDNYPNPFNPSTTISFSIPERIYVTLKVYDVLGREVAVLVNEELEPGIFEKTFEASTLSSGVYIYRVTAMKDGKILFSESKQMLLIK